MLDEDRADRARADAAAAFGHRNSLTTRQNLPAPRPPAARRRKPSRLPTGAAPGDGAPPRQRPRRQQEHRHPERQGGQPEPPPPADPPRLSTVDEQEQRPQPLHQHEDPDPPGHLHTQHRGGVGDAGDVPRPIHSHLRVPAVHQLTGVPVRDRQGRAVVVGHGGGRLRNTHRQLHLRVMPPRTPPRTPPHPLRGGAARSAVQPADDLHPGDLAPRDVVLQVAEGRRVLTPQHRGQQDQRSEGQQDDPEPGPSPPRGRDEASGTTTVSSTLRNYCAGAGRGAPCTDDDEPRLLVPSDVASSPSAGTRPAPAPARARLARRSRPRRSLAVRRTGRCRVTDARTTPAPGAAGPRARSSMAAHPRRARAR